MSRRRYILLFLYGAGFFAGVLGGWIDDIEKIIVSINTGDDADIANAVSTLDSNVTLTYNITSDKTAVTLSDLKAAIDDLYSKQQKHHGTTTNKLLDMQFEAEKLMDEKRQIDNNVFRWAVMGRERFKFIVENRNEINSTDRIKIFTDDIWSKGMSVIGRSISEYEILKETFVELLNKSKSVKDDLQLERECTIDHFEEYERNRTKFNSDLEQTREITKKEFVDCEARRKLAIEKKKSTIFEKTANLFREEEIVSCADEAYNKAKAEKEQMWPSKEAEKRKDIQYYDNLLASLDHVLAKVGEAATTINDDRIYITKLKERIAKRPDISVGSAAELIVDYMAKFGSQLDEYIRRHMDGVVVDFDTDNTFKTTDEPRHFGK